MKFGVVNKSTILNRFDLHILHRNITHLAKNKHNTRYFERWGGVEEPQVLLHYDYDNVKVVFKSEIQRWALFPPEPPPPSSCKILLV